MSAVREHNAPTRTIIAPTIDEAQNISLLVKLLREAVAPLDGVTRLLVIDDSKNTATVDAVTTAAAEFGTSRFVVEGFRRVGAERIDGLSGAVVHGIRMCSTDEYVCVIDGDGQHPAYLSRLLFQIAECVDVVTTSRYRSGGSADGLNGFMRHVVSRGTNLAAKLLFPRLLGEVSDPMTGYFVFRRSAVDIDRLKSDGFKILVELLCAHRGLRILELPMQFGERTAGNTKSDIRTGFKFVRQLLRLRFATRRALVASS